VEAYAAGPYLTDLLRGERDPLALSRITEKVAGYTGLDPALVRKLGGRVDMATFARERERAAQRSQAFTTRASAVSILSRMARRAIIPIPFWMRSRPRLRARWPISPATVSAGRSMRAMKSSTKTSTMPGTGGNNGRGQAEALSDLKRAMALDPSLRVLVAHGVTDQVTPYFASSF